jgi:hypothetical protein
MQRLFLVLFLLSLVDTAQARPISYTGGITLMQRNNWERSKLHLHYSPSPKDSLGLVFQNYNDGGRKDFGLQWNHLLWRKNTKGSQANLYSKIIGGIARDSELKEPFVNFKLSADWETRKHFLAANTGYEHAGEFDDGSVHFGGRIGVAPYVADSGALHTWLMLQVEHHPEQKDEDNRFLITPLIRVFKSNYLGELGVNQNGDVMFNFVIRH